MALASELSRDAATVELLGSSETCHAAKETYANARRCADMYQARSMDLAMAREALNFTLTPFDADQAQQLCEELDAAISAFVQAARHEMTSLLYVREAAAEEQLPR